MAATVTVGYLIGGPLTDLKIGTAASEVSVGPTLAGLRLSKEVGATRDFVTQQTKGTLKKEEASGIKYFVSTVLAHATMENLRIALNQIAANLSGSTLTVDEDEMVECSLVAEGPGPNGLTRTITCHKIKSMQTGDIVSWEQDAQQGIPVMFEVIQDASTKKWWTTTN